jgi:hypothetical protein
MNIEKAIRKIKEFGLHHAIQDLPHSELTVEAFEMAISALEKQIPKKVKQYNDKSIFIYEGVFYCPSCQENVSMDDVYCCQCGQSLDWEEENE